MMTEQGASMWTVLLHDVSLQAREIPGIKIFRSSATIYYTNADMYLDALQEKVRICVSMYVGVCLIARCIPLCCLQCPSLFANCFSPLLSHIPFSLFNDSCLFFSCRVDLSSGSCWQRKKKEMPSWSVNKRKRKRELKRRRRNKYECPKHHFTRYL